MSQIVLVVLRGKIAILLTTGQKTQMSALVTPMIELEGPTGTSKTTTPRTTSIPSEFALTTT
jgi:hypothetical protein